MHPDGGGTLINHQFASRTTWSFALRPWHLRCSIKKSRLGPQFGKCLRIHGATPVFKVGKKIMRPAI